MIKLENVFKIYTMGQSQIYALNDVSFSINKGEFVSIMGPSGSGKSTCMNLIGALDTPTSGNIFINGQNTQNMTEKSLAHLRNKTIGFVFQQYHLLSSLTVLENVMLPLKYQNIKIQERKEKALLSLEKVNLVDRQNHLPHELSGGQKQRVAIARAMVTQPKIILADEPTGALDSETGAKVLKIFRQINKEGTTVILVTHDEKIGNSANRLIKILDGRIIQDKDLC